MSTWFDTGEVSRRPNMRDEVINQPIYAFIHQSTECTVCHVSINELLDAEIQHLL